jgi:hypothetical protein
MQNSGTLISAPIRPNDSLDQYASAFANEIKGGSHGYETYVEMFDIIEARREWGMLVNVYNDSDPDLNGTYQLKHGYYNNDILDNSNWEKLNLGENTSTEWVDSVISILTIEPTLEPFPGHRYLLGTIPSLSPLGTNWDNYSYGTIIVEYSNVGLWKVTIPTNGMTVRVDNDNNSIYKYEGTYPNGIWKQEKITQVFYIEPSGNGLTYSVSTDPIFNEYSRDLIFLTKFNTANNGTASININGLGYKDIKIATKNGVRDLIITDIITNGIYSLTYNGTYFQMTKPFPSDAYNIQYYIGPGEVVTVEENEQYWVYGDLTIDGGVMQNYGHVVIANGAVNLVNGGAFNNNMAGELILVDLTNTIAFNTTDTIQLSSEMTVNGPSVSAIVLDNSLKTNHLNSINTATASWIVSNDGNGSFQWEEFNALSLSYVPSGLTLTANNVQGAIDQLDSLVTDDNVIMVKKGATGSGQYETINEALDSILSPSVTNRWTIAVGAGDFYEDTITMKPWVNIVGRDRTTRIIAATSSQHVFIGADFASVISCLVTGAGPGYAAFYHTSPTGTAQSAFVIKDVIFGENDSHVICYADTNQTTVQVIDCRYGDDFIFDKGFYAYNNSFPTPSSVAARILLLHCYSQGMSAVTKPTYFAKASGENCEIVMNSVQANAAGTIQLGTTFLIIENGAKCRLNAVNFTNWDKGIWVPFLNIVGELGSKLIGVAVSCQSTNDHILIENEDTYGQLSGTFEKAKVTTLSSDVSLTYADPEVGDFTIAGGLNVTYTPTVTTDISTLIERSSTMGVIEGGYITEGLGLTLSVAAGFGYYHINSSNILNRFDWPTTEISIPSNSTYYIYFNSSNQLIYDVSIPDTSENILLGRVRTNTIGFEFIERTPLFAEHWANKATKLFRKGIGPVYSNGSIVSENATQSLHLDVSQGTYYYGANEFNPAGGTDITFESYRPDGLGDWIVVATNSVDNTYYSGTNSLIALSTGYFAKHSLYLVGDNGEERYFMVYDNSEHIDLLSAQVASLPIPPSYFSDAVALIAGIVVQQGTSSIVEIRDQRPVVGFRAAGINASADHSSLINLAADDHQQYLLTNGARILTGDLQMGSYSIQGVNLINSINIESHASRHLPGAIDGLLTGTPSTIGVTNQIGSIAAFARQDHIHAHGNLDGGSLHALVTTTQSGFMSFGDKVILDNITSSTQSLTNKGITGSTNYVDANGLKTTTDPVYIVSTAPSIGQVLISTSATQATWQTIPTGTPSTIGTVSQIGTSSNYARQDHIHSHGDQAGGSLHATASTTTAGFMSANDKVILDNITSSTQSLTNKTIIGTTNYVDTNGLKTTTNPVYIVATAPSVNQVLMAISATQATWQTPALATSTQSGFMSFGDKVILDNITSSTQSLTNKGITGSTNYVETNALKTNTNPVYIVATAPSIGQVLTAVSATAATWQTPTAASTQKNPTDPTVTSSTVGVMMGLSASITPVLSGKIMIIISGDMDNDTGDDGAQVQMITGTGTPPINGAALTGTTQGGLVKMSVVVSGGATAVTRVPFSLNAIVTGLTLNTAVWIDISLAAIGAGNARVRDVSISVVEL